MSHDPRTRRAPYSDLVSRKRRSDGSRSKRPTSPPVIVAEDDLRIHFQPIVSVRERAIFAVEALSRARDSVRGTEVQPHVLFRVAEELDLLPSFDRFCRRRAAELFLANVPAEDGVLLTVNWDARCLAAHEEDPQQFSRLVRRLGLSPSDLMIEILESSVEDTRALTRFAHARRREGFLVAVDDYGTGQSSLERVALIEPDVIKVDRCLVEGLAESHAKQEACHAVVEMARNIGAIVVAEGIEREADVHAALALGFDFFQGFYFARPNASYVEAKLLSLAKVESVADHLSELSRAQIDERRRQKEHLAHVFGEVFASIAGKSADEFHAVLARAVSADGALEAGYVLDANGVQVTETHIRSVRADDRRTRAFRPAQKGADQSLKEYYLSPSLGEGTYTSRPYVSMATGTLCITMSRYFVSATGGAFLLCCDIPASAR